MTQTLCDYCNQPLDNTNTVPFCKPLNIRGTVAVGENGVRDVDTLTFTIDVHPRVAGERHPDMCVNCLRQVLRSARVAGDYGKEPDAVSAKSSSVPPSDKIRDAIIHDLVKQLGGHAFVTMEALMGAPPSEELVQTEDCGDIRLTVKRREDAQ